MIIDELLIEMLSHHVINKSVMPRLNIAEVGSANGKLPIVFRDANRLM